MQLVRVCLVAIQVGRYPYARINRPPSTFNTKRVPILDDTLRDLLKLNIRTTVLLICLDKSSITT